MDMLNAAVSNLQEIDTHAEAMRRIICNFAIGLKTEAVGAFQNFAPDFSENFCASGDIHVLSLLY